MAQRSNTSEVVLVVIETAGDVILYVNGLVVARPERGFASLTEWSEIAGRMAEALYCKPTIITLRPEQDLYPVYGRNWTTEHVTALLIERGDIRSRMAS